MIEAFEDDGAGALGDDEAVATQVEGFTSAARVVASGCKGAQGGEAGEEERRQGRFGAAGDHDVGVAAADNLGCLADGAGAGSAGGDDGHVGPESAGKNGDLAGDRVRQDVGEEKGADTAVALAQEEVALLVEEDVTAGAGAEDDACLRPEGQMRLEAGIGHGFEGGDGAHLDVAVHVAPVAGGQTGFRLEVAHLTGDRVLKGRGVEAGYMIDAGATGDQRLPGRWHVVAEGRDGPDAADDDPRHGRSGGLRRPLGTLKPAAERKAQVTASK